jgi:hypothetical protein
MIFFVKSRTLRAAAKPAMAPRMIEGSISAIVPPLSRS